MEIHLVVLAVLIAEVKCYLMIEEQPMPFADDRVILGERTGYFNSPSEIQKHAINSRVRRQVQSIVSVNVKEGNPKLSAKLPVARSDNNALSVIGSQSADSRSIGLMLGSVNGHALSIAQLIIPAFGKQLMAIGRVNLINTDNHSISVNSILTKNLPKYPTDYNYFTYGGQLDYTFKNKVKTLLGAARTDYQQRTDLSALGHFNLFHNKNVSLFFNVGMTVSFSPFMSKSSWVPIFGFSVSIV